MKKLVLALLCISTLSLYGIETLKKVKYDVVDIDSSEEAVTETSINQDLGFAEVYVNSINRQDRHGEYMPAQLAREIGSTTERLSSVKTSLYSAEPSLSQGTILKIKREVGVLQSRINTVYEKLITELLGMVEDLQNDARQYLQLPAIEKPQHAEELIRMYNAVVERCNALSEAGIDVRQDDLNQAYNDITGVENDLGIN